MPVEFMGACAFFLVWSYAPGPGRPAPLDGLPAARSAAALPGRWWLGLLAMDRRPW